MSATPALENARSVRLEGAARILAVLADIPESDRLEALAMAANLFCGGHLETLVDPERRGLRPREAASEAQKETPDART